ncbi:MAG: OsmC family protein [Chloroflexi bacterium]|nr:OsmC family protein [Chloroflexota bacterium]
MEARLSLKEGMRFVGTVPSGHTLVLDAAQESGGTDAGPRPMELLLLALGTCTGMDVISILHKKRQKVTGYEIVVRAERAADYPRIYTSMTVEHIVRGKRISPEAVRRAIELSDEKYCSVGAMLRQSAALTSTFRIVDD